MWSFIDFATLAWYIFTMLTNHDFIHVELDYSYLVIYTLVYLINVISFLLYIARLSSILFSKNLEIGDIVMLHKLSIFQTK
jgi:hypothetical protein